MKKLYTFLSLLLLLLLSASVWSQSPEKMSYQAVIRNSSSQLITNQAVGMRISILQGSATGMVVYSETQTASTNANGLLTIEIGIEVGFDTIHWENGPYFIKTETDPTGGTNYSIGGTSQLLSVPYALYAKTAGNITGNITETDPLFVASPAHGILSSQILNWDSAYSWGNHATVGYLTSYTETDPIFATSPAYGISSSQIIKWDSTYGWGNHSLAGYLTSFTETDPIFGASPAQGILSSQITNWNTAFGWGNHALAGYMTSFTETDPIWTSDSSDYYTKINIQTSGQSQLHFDNITNRPTTLAGYGITDAMNTSHVANGITSTNITNWNSAYGWGNHALAGYLTSFTEVDPEVGTNTTGFSPIWDGTALTTGLIFQGSGKVGIGTTTPSAVLDISSQTGGILIPRMTTAERDLISSPALGLQIYNTTTNCFNVWSGSTWGQICPDCGFTPVAGNNGPICAGLTLSLSAETITGATYNWTGPNGFTSTLQNPSIPNATTAASGAYYVAATVSGCTSAPTSIVATVNPSLGATSATYNSPVCINSTLNLSTTSIPGASYTWSGPNNYFANIQNPSISNIQASHAGTYYVAATQGGCTSNSSVDVAVKPIPTQPGTISGTFALLAPQTGISFSINPIANTTSYSWTYSGTGATINGQGSNSITIDFACGATSGSLSVKANNECGGSSPIQSQAIIITTLAQPDVITGTTPVVPPQSGTVYSTNSVSGATSYAWTVPASLGTIVSGQGTTSITVDFVCGATSGVISVAAVNACGAGLSRTKTINIGTIGTPSTITGLSNIPYPQNGVQYSVSAVSGATSYNWTVPSGATIASGQGSNSILVNYACGTASGNISVTAANACGSGGTNSVSITVSTSTPAMPGGISGTNNLPAGLSGVTYSITPIANATSYMWSVPSGAGISSGQGTSSIVVYYNCAAVSGNISVAAVNDCGMSSQRTMAVTVNSSPSQPAAITGSNSVPSGGTGITYSIPTVTGATTYTWSYTGTGGTITSGQGSNFITVDYSCTATNGNISVTSSNTCAVESIPRTLPITITGTVSTPGVITGTSTPLKGQTNTPYSVVAISGASIYTWTVPTGATIVSGQGTTSILVDIGCAAVAGNISVAASNACVAGGAPRTLAINPGTSIAAPGAITGLNSVAQGRTGVVYTITPVTGATINTWSYTGTGANIISGQGSTSITVDYACNATNGNISVTSSNACVGPSTASTMAITVNALATPGAITGPTSVPQGSTGIQYTIATVPGATSYSWIVPVGATIAFGQGTTSIWVDYGCTVGSGNILVTANNACGSSGGSSLNITISSSIPATPSFNSIPYGNSIPKGMKNVFYGVSAVTGATSYTWTVPAGATITSGQGSTMIIVDFSCAATNGNVSVVANNTCGSSVAANYSMNIMASPSQPGGITGTTSVPKGSSGFTYSISSVPGASLYTWTVPAGANITSGQGTISITVDYSCTASSGNITVNSSNVCGTASGNSILAITTTSTLASLGVITGTTSPLLGQAGTSYSVTPIIGATSYSWSVPSGASVSSGQGTASIGVDFSCAATNGTIMVSASNGCVSTSPVSLSFALSSVALAQPAAIIGLISVPRGTTSVEYSIAAVTGTTSYTWTVPANTTIVSGQGTTSIKVDFSSCSGASGNIGVTAVNGCVANSPERTLAVTITTTALPTPGSITGTQTPIFGQNNVTYSIADVSGATTYTWSYSGSGVNIVSGQGTKSITVNYACVATNGNLSVTASNGCVATSPTQSLAITLGNSMATPSAINGTQAPIYGQNGVSYSISPVAGASNYIWTVGTGAIIAYGQGTTSISVNFSCAAAANGTISVVASNTCSISSPAAAMSYSMGGDMPNPGTIAGFTTVPKGINDVVYSISPLASATSYTWSVPVGCTITSGQGTNSIKVDFGCTAVSGNVSVSATNSCTTSPASNLAITVSSTLAIPGAIAGTTTPVVGSVANYSIVSISGATSYNWTAPAGASIVSGAGTNSVYYSFDCSAVSGNISVTVNNGCLVAGTARTLAITPVASSPIGTLGSITETINPGMNSRSYSVASIGAATYTWTVSTGITIVSGQGSPMITTTSSGSIVGTIGVTASNICQSQSTSSSLPINYSGIAFITATGEGQYGSIQSWTVPAGVTSINIEVYGAQGGNSNYYSIIGGNGARMKGTFSVTPGEVLKVLVGQKGADGNYRGGGGGGTFVTDNNNNPLIVAGGGSRNPGQITNSGGSNGGIYMGCAGGGGGLTGNGADGFSEGGKSFIAGGFGGNPGSYGVSGGFGGGAGSECSNCCSFGGGGGYSGGTHDNGGGSYNAGINQSNVVGANAGGGKVIITW